MNILQFLMEAMKDSKTNLPSSKRVGHIAGIAVSAITVLVLIGIVVGLSIDVKPMDFQFVYSQLLNTVIFLSGMLMGAGTTAYITTKNKEGIKGNDNG